MVIIGSDGEPRKIEGSVQDLSSDAAKLIATIYSYVMEYGEASTEVKAKLIDALTEAILQTVMELCDDLYITDGILKACKTVWESEGIIPNTPIIKNVKEGGMTS